MSVLYCIGERSVEQDAWQQVLGDQLRLGLDGVNKKQVIIAYEPIWSIGPGKTPADRSYITKIARFIKEQTGGMEVVYGGGLKSENAAMLASIPEIDGGLIALTRFSGEIGFYPEEYLDIIRQYTRVYLNLHSCLILPGHFWRSFRLIPKALSSKSSICCITKAWNSPNIPAAPRLTSATFYRIPFYF